MTLGGFTASVRITKTRISGGLLDGGEKYSDADMELEGKLLVANLGAINENLIHKSKSEVFVEIEFVKNLEAGFSYLIYGETKYIGKIHLSEIDNIVRSFVRVTLPLSMFPLLRSMNGETIKVETIHDAITNPNNDQKLDNIVAYVKRVYFETFANVDE